MHDQPSAAFLKKEVQHTMIISVPSSSKNGEYLIGVCLIGEKLIVAHQCPASNLRKRCKHVDIARTAFNHYFSASYKAGQEITINKKIMLTDDLVQIPVEAMGYVRGDYNEQHTA